MSTPEPPSGPPAEAPAPGEPGAQPGHRARNLAASLLGELTGQRKSGLTFAPLEPSGLSVERREPVAVEQSPPDADAPAPTPSVAPSVSPSVAPPVAPEAPRLVAVPEPEQARDDADSDADSDAGTDPGSDAAPDASEQQAPAADEDGQAGVRPEPVASDDDQLDRLTAAATTPERPSATPVVPVAGPAVPAASSVSGPSVSGVPANGPAVSAPSVTGPSETGAGGSATGASVPVSPHIPAAAVPGAPAAQTGPDSGQRPAATRPEPVETGPVTGTPSPAASLAPQQPQASSELRPKREGGGSGNVDVRPAPFAYLAVAQHHTNPARATANGALDQAGQRISSRVDRALVRRAAQVSMEAASLLDACDVLDGRARAADATWTGDHHSPTEVREFEGAWGAFYDAQNALAQHVTS